MDKAVFDGACAAAVSAQQEILVKVYQKEDNIDSLIAAAGRRMSNGAAAIRDPAAMTAALADTRSLLTALADTAGVGEPKGLYRYYKLRDILVTQTAVLTAMLDYAETVGDTRGSALYFDKKGTLRQGLEEMFRFTEEDGSTKGRIQETCRDGDGFACSWRPVRPLPEGEVFFENVWRGYRENGNVF